MPTSSRRSILLGCTFLLLTLLFYGGASLFLAGLGTSFEWCSISQPKSIVAGQSLNIEINLKHVDQPLYLVAALRGGSGKANRSFYPKHSPIPVHSAGPITLKFDLPKLENIRAIHFAAYLSKTGKWKDRVTRSIAGPPMRVTGVHTQETTKSGFWKEAGSILHKAINGRWQQSRGDPTLFGWLVTLAFFAAGLACMRLARKLARSRQQLVAIPTFDLTQENSTPLPVTNNFDSGHLHYLWWFFAIMLLAFSINKQLDLQTLLTDFGREFSKSSGWYEERQFVQQKAVLWLATAGFSGMLILVYWSGKYWRYCWPAVLGTALLTSFTILRAISFHQTDQILGVRLGQMRLRLLLELSSALLIGICAWRNLKKIKS